MERQPCILRVPLVHAGGFGQGEDVDDLAGEAALFLGCDGHPQLLVLRAEVTKREREGDDEQDRKEERKPHREPVLEEQAGVLE